MLDLPCRPDVCVIHMYLIRHVCFFLKKMIDGIMVNYMILLYSNLLKSKSLNHVVNNCFYEKEIVGVKHILQKYNKNSFSSCNE